MDNDDKDDLFGSDNKSRYNVTANNANKKLFEHRLKCARQGRKILETKALLLKKEFGDTAKKIKKIKGDSYNAKFRQSYFSLVETKYVARDITFIRFEKMNSTKKIRMNTKNVSGSILLEFKEVDTQAEKPFMLYGGEQLEKCIKQFQETLSILIELGTLETNYKILDRELKKANRRVNTLKKVLIPKFKNTIKYIEIEQDGFELEDKFRIKRIQDKKKLKRIQNKKKLDDENEILFDDDLIQNDDHDTNDNHDTINNILSMEDDIVV